MWISHALTDVAGTKKQNAFSISACERPRRFDNIIATAEEAAALEDLRRRTAALSLEDSFLLQALRARDFVVPEAAEVCSNFVTFRRGAGWPYRISALAIQPALVSGMHWLLPGTDREGRAACLQFAIPR